MCNNCNQNNCTDCTQETNICNQCQPEQVCDCAVKDLSTDCSIYNQDDIECDSIVVVAKNTILSDALANIVSWSCTKFSGIEKFFRIINTGTGAEIYSGTNLLGEKKLRKLKSTSPVITVIQNTDDISLGVDSTSLDSFIEANQKTYTISNLGTGAQVYKDSTIVSNNTQFNIRKIKSSNSSVNIVEGVDEIDITVVAGIVPDGSETKITAGTNVSVTGAGTTVSPYVINASGGSVVSDATNTVKGILRLVGDLGGTADLPTTPTALHKTGNESFTGIKSSTNTGDTQVNGLSLTNNGTGDSTSLYINNTAGGKGIDILNTNGYGQYITNTDSGYGLGITNSLSGGGIFIDNLATGIGNIITNNAAGTGIYISNNSSGKGLEVFTYGTGRGINVNGTLGSTAFSYVGQNNGTNTFTVDKLGNITANSFIKTSGTALQRLLADGTVEDTNKQKVITYPGDFTGTNYTLTNADNNYEIIVDNGTTAVTITVPSGLTPKIGIGFTQKGTGDVTYVQSSTTIQNPIGLKIKGQYYQTFLSQELATNLFYLGGNTKI